MRKLYRIFHQISLHAIHYWLQDGTGPAFYYCKNINMEMWLDDIIVLQKNVMTIIKFQMTKVSQNEGTDIHKHIFQDINLM